MPAGGAGGAGGTGTAANSSFPGFDSGGLTFPGFNPPAYQSNITTPALNLPSLSQTNATPGAPGQTPGDLLNQLAQSYQSANDQANAANQARLTAGSQGYSDLLNRSLGRLDTYSGQMQQDIENQYNQLAQSAEQGLISRGLSNTTIRPSVLTGITSAKLQDLRRLQDDLVNQRLNTDAGLTQAGLQFQERATQQGPDFGTLAALAQAMGVGGSAQTFPALPAATSGTGTATTPASTVPALTGPAPSGYLSNGQPYYLPVSYRNSLMNNIRFQAY